MKSHTIKWLIVSMLLYIAGVPPAEALSQGDITPSSLDEVYMVKAGDWLSKICLTHGCDWKEVAQINQIPNPNLIYVGQKLAGVLKNVPTDGLQKRKNIRSTVSQFAQRTSSVDGKLFHWKNPGSDVVPKGTLVAPKLRELNYSEEDITTFMEMVSPLNDTNVELITLTRGQHIGTMTSGSGKLYHNTVVDFDTTKYDARAKRYVILRKVDIDGEAYTRRIILIEPMVCGNWSRPPDEFVPVAEPPPIVREDYCSPTSSCGARLYAAPQPTPASDQQCTTGPESACICSQNTPSSEQNSYQSTTRRLIPVGEKILPIQRGHVQCPSLDEPQEPTTNYLATFTVLGGAVIAEHTPEAICGQTPDVEYKGLQLICMPDGSVRNTE